MTTALEQPIHLTQRQFDLVLTALAQLAPGAAVTEHFERPFLDYAPEAVVYSPATADELAATAAVLTAQARLQGEAGVLRLSLDVRYEGGGDATDPDTWLRQGKESLELLVERAYADALMTGYFPELLVGSHTSRVDPLPTVVPIRSPSAGGEPVRHPYTVLLMRNSNDTYLTTVKAVDRAEAIARAQAEAADEDCGGDAEARNAPEDYSPLCVFEGQHAEAGEQWRGAQPTVAILDDYAYFSRVQNGLRADSAGAAS